ncbi:MAG: thioredoxin domain-containing protein [Polyangiaceae bacterium]
MKRLLVVLVTALLAACAGAPPPEPGAAGGRGAPTVEVGGQTPGAAVVSDAAIAGDVAPGTQVPVRPGEPSWGDPTALVTLVVWGDYQDPFSTRLMTTLPTLRERLGPTRLRIVWKHNPLPFHKDAHAAHVAAESVLRLGGQAAFWRFHDLCFANQKTLDRDHFVDWAEAAGVDADRFEAAFDSQRFARKVDEDVAEGQAIGVIGAPVSRINGVALTGAQPLEKFLSIIDEQTQLAEARLRAGTPRHRLYAELSDENQRKGAAPTPSAASTPAPEDDERTVFRLPVGKSPVRGPATALVTIVMFTDLECPFCVKVMTTLDELLVKYEGKLRLVYKHNALPFHPEAEREAAVAMEARAQHGDAGFWKAVGVLFARTGEITAADYAAFGSALKVDAARLRGAVDKKRYQAAFEDDQLLADDVKATGTPHFFINGRRLVGAQPRDKFEKLIDEELAKASKLVAAGTQPAAVYDAIMKTANPGPPLPRVKVPAPTAAQPSRGAKNARVVIQMFSDLQCPFCAKVEPTLDDLLREFPGQVRIVFRHLPLPFHTHAAAAAEAAEEAFRQKGDKGFWAMADLIFEDQSASALSRAGLADKARKLKLDVAAFDAALDTGRHRPKLEADRKVAAEAGFSGTPGFAIGDYFLGGAQPLANFRRLVRKALGPPSPPSPDSLLEPSTPFGPLQATPTSAQAVAAAEAPQFSVSHLLVSYQGAKRAAAGITRTKAEARARAEEALRVARSGVAFEQVVARFSDEPGAAPRGGNLGTFKRGDMAASFQAAVEATAPGNLSGVVETEFGFHVLLRRK